MKIQHRVPFSDFSQNMEGKVDPDYMREVDRSTSKLEREYRRAEKRFAAAERRAKKEADIVEKTKQVSEKRAAKKRYKVALEKLEEYRMELDRLARIMQESPAGAAHRGTKSFVPVPK